MTQTGACSFTPLRHSTWRPLAGTLYRQAPTGYAQTRLDYWLAYALSLSKTRIAGVPVGSTLMGVESRREHAHVAVQWPTYRELCAHHVCCGQPHGRFLRLCCRCMDINQPHGDYYRQRGAHRRSDLLDGHRIRLHCSDCYLSDRGYAIYRPSDT